MRDRESDNDRGNRPVETLRDGALKTAIFRNENEHGDSYAIVPGRIYTDKKTGQVRETHSLGGHEALRMGHLLTRAHDRIGQLREQYKEQNREQNRDQQRGDRAPSRSRDSGRER